MMERKKRKQKLLVINRLIKLSCQVFLNKHISDDTCNLNVVFVAKNESDQSSWYEDFTKNVVKDLQSDKNIQSLHSRILKAEENEDNLTNFISETFKQFNVPHATNVVIFFTYPDSNDYVKSAVAKSVKQGDQIYCVSSVKVTDWTKVVELLTVCDFANLFFSPSSRTVSERLGCKTFY